MFNSQTFRLSNGATFGTVIGTTVSDLIADRAAWDAYGDGANDDNSRMAGSNIVRLGGGFGGRRGGLRVID